MKFMIHWKPIETRRMEHLKHVADTKLDSMAEAMDVLGIQRESSYHLADQSGFSVVEAESIQKVMQVCLPWTGVNNITVQPIMTDSEAQEAARGALAMVADFQGFQENNTQN